MDGIEFGVGLESWQKTCELGRNITQDEFEHGLNHSGRVLVGRSIRFLGSSEETTKGVCRVAEAYYPGKWIERSNSKSPLYVSNRNFVDWALTYFNIVLSGTVVFMLGVTLLALLREGWSAAALAATVVGCFTLLVAVVVIEAIRRAVGRRPEGYVGGSYFPLPFGLGGIISLDDPGGGEPDDRWKAAAVHELAHRFEHVMDEIGHREKEFFAYRKGKFFHDYSGKRYLFGNRWEILSVGHEYMMFGGVNMPSNKDISGIDDEHRDFVKGLMREFPKE